MACIVEDMRLLILNNATHLFCLHFVFTPRVNQHLEMFRSGYDNHPLSSESNMTPIQLWMDGLFTYEGKWDPSEEGLASFGVD